VERRFAVLAGDDTQALSRRRARRRTWLVVLALASVASPAAARPKRRDARVAFDRGVAAYKKGSFEAAAEALGKSFELERDADTLFAWAQSERKLERCDKAIELYEKLLTFDLPQANKDAVSTSLAECRAQVPTPEHKVEPPPVTPPPVTPPPVTPQANPKVESPPEPGRIADRAMAPPSASPTDTPHAARAWYKDPIALTLVGSGVVGIGVGAGFLVSASAAHSDFMSAKSYNEAQQLLDKAQSRQTIGFVAAGAGAALVAGGVVWILVHRDSTEQHAVTGWLAPSGGGLAVAGAF
jgi:tetratricopeptide (TPR) repeat protein